MTARMTLQVRLTPKALQLLQALAVEQGINKSAVLETIIRKMAEEVEDRMPKVYDVLHAERD